MLRSVPRVVVILGSMAIGWQNRRHKCVTIATYKAEYTSPWDVLNKTLFTRVVLALLQQDTNCTFARSMVITKARRPSRTIGVAQRGASTFKNPFHPRASQRGRGQILMLRNGKAVRGSRAYRTSGYQGLVKGAACRFVLDVPVAFMAHLLHFV